MAAKAFSFSSTARSELTVLGLDRETVGALADAVDDCRRRIANRQGSKRLKMARADVRRIKTRAATLLRAIDAADARVQFNARGHRAAIVDLLDASRTPSGRPVDHVRRQFEHAIGQVLHRAGIPLSQAPGSKLARVLATVILEADGSAPEEDRLRQICRRLRDDADAEATATAALDNLLR